MVILHYMVYKNNNYNIVIFISQYEIVTKNIGLACAKLFIMKGGQIMSQEILRNRLLNIIRYEGVNQKFIAKQTKISEGLLSRFKNNKTELDLLDSESLDKYLLSKGY